MQQSPLRAQPEALDALEIAVSTPDAGFAPIFAASKPRRAGATRCASPSLPATASPSGSPNNRAARAEASTTLTVISIGADQGGGLARRMQPEPTNLGEDFGGRRGTVFLRGRLDDRQEFALQRSVVPSSREVNGPPNVCRHLPARN